MSLPPSSRHQRSAKKRQRARKRRPPRAPAGTTVELADGAEPLVHEPLVGETIGIDDFTKVDLRVARVIVAEEVPKAKKLLKLTLSLGGDQRAPCSPASRARMIRHNWSAD